MLLAIDTSAGTSVAVVDREGGVLSEIIETDTMRHAEVIGTLIDEALTVAGIEVRALSGVVAGMGPGPFTGLRIGIAAARAFAIGRGIPVVPVASHDAAAFEILEQDPEAEFVIVTDARRRENAVSAYAGLKGGLPNRIAGPDLRPHTEDPQTAPALTTAIPAVQLARIAARQLKEGATEHVDPLYLRAPDAKIPGAVKRVST